MTVTLYRTSSLPNAVNKAIIQVDTYSGVLREPTSILDPVVVIQRTSPVGFNYVYIPEFKRYYFVNGVSVVSNTLISIAMHVDVLMSYKDGIDSTTAVIKRQENDYNLLLDDGIFKAYQNPKHKIIRFPNSFSSFSYVLALAGNGQVGST